MSYSRRISLALAAAATLVSGIILSAPTVLQRIDAITFVPMPERVIQLDLRKLEPRPAEPKAEPVKRLVEAGAPTDAVAQDTDLISSQASRAQDMSEAAGDPNRPAAKEIDDFDQLGQNATPPAPEAPEPTPPASTPSPTPVPAPEEAEAMESPPTPSPAETKPLAAPEPVKTESGKAAPKLSESAQSKEPSESESAEPTAKESVAEKPAEVKPAPEPFKVAQATPPPRIPTQELRAEKGREGGGAEDSGFTSFEANKHALGEYMLGVRKRVERQWRSALHLRYVGASRTEAVIHCVIRPDGTIESASIVDAGTSLTYAVLCREAVEKAGPFGAFPFDVPEIYRNDNLEINWKFSYL